MALPLPLRNQLAELILESLHDAQARRALEALASPEGEAPAFSMKEEWRPYADELADRARRAWRALQSKPLESAAPSLSEALPSAALLFDAALYFEVHELLEPYWLRAEGTDREALQGLIQIAVGFQHLANGNMAGARALLRDGCAKTAGRTVVALDLDPFARATRDCLGVLESPGAAAFEWTRVPRFPSKP